MTLVLFALITAVPLAAQQPGSPSLGQGPGAGPVLSVPYHAQSTQVWCWAACVAMELNYNGGGFTDCDVVSYVFQVPCSAAVTTASTQAMQYAMWNMGGLHSLIINRPLTFQEVMGEIDNGRPVILGYQGSFSGHVTVLYGYDSSTTSVDIHDPYYGTYTQLPFGVAFTYGGSLSWTQTIYGVAPGPLPGPPNKPKDPGCSTADDGDEAVYTYLVALVAMAMVVKLWRSNCG